jgi:Fic family protein
MPRVTPAPTFEESWNHVRTDRLDDLLRRDAKGLETDGEYLHWDKLRHLTPPHGLSSHEWWWTLKVARRTSMRQLPLLDPAGTAFGYTQPDSLLRALHRIDQQCSGQIAMSEVVTADEQARQHYLVNSLMEEAIRSSQLEGASTSRRVAKDLLQSGRAPRDRSEKMILNNYLALRFMRESMGDTLTPELVLELHRILTEGTLDDPEAAGRLQRPDEERVAVVDRLDGTVLHQPPPAEQLPQRLRELCDFANEVDRDAWVHPVVRGILLHFWLAYDHPFEDGNGRTARALFYWYMKTHGYWLVEYLSISHILREAPGQYMKSYLHTETDEGDATYFLLYQVEVIERAIDQLQAYLRRQVEEIQTVERLLKGTAELNHRQLAVLGDALRTPDASYGFAGHAANHAITHETARTDLSALADRGLLEKRRLGRRFTFVAPDDLADRLKALA